MITPVEIVPDLPEALRRFILKACRRDPLQRYQDVEQALEDLQPIVQEYGLTRKSQTKEKRKMTTLFLVYKDEHQASLDRLMDEFSAKACEHGVVLKVVDTGRGMV